MAPRFGSHNSNSSRGSWKLTKTGKNKGELEIWSHKKVRPKSQALVKAKHEVVAVAHPFALDAMPFYPGPSGNQVLYSVAPYYYYYGSYMYYYPAPLVTYPTYMTVGSSVVPINSIGWHVL